LGEAEFSRSGSGILLDLSSLGDDRFLGDDLELGALTKGSFDQPILKAMETDDGQTTAGF